MTSAATIIMDHNFLSLAHPEKELASVSIGAPLLGKMEVWSFLRAYEIKRYIKKYVKMPCKRVSLSIGASFWNLEGIRLPEPFWGEKYSISGFLS
jgi:hypothetical protein